MIFTCDKFFGTSDLAGMCSCGELLLGTVSQMSRMKIFFYFFFFFNSCNSKIGTEAVIPPTKINFAEKIKDIAATNNAILALSGKFLELHSVHSFGILVHFEKTKFATSHGKSLFIGKWQTWCTGNRFYIGLPNSQISWIIRFVVTKWNGIRSVNFLKNKS